DLIKFNKSNLQKKIFKLKSINIKKSNKQKIYLNQNVKSLINIVKTYSMNGILDYEKFRDLARNEEIVDQKFQIHFNQACFLGYLKKLDKQVHFIMDYD
ncbi:MAG: hypothetical protein ACFFB9_17575, partial [Promethearchaeota archaeon]